jgi:hypothetical protein
VGVAEALVGGAGEPDVAGDVVGADEPPPAGRWCGRGGEVGWLGGAGGGGWWGRTGATRGVAGEPLGLSEKAQPSKPPGIASWLAAPDALYAQEPPFGADQ